MPNVIHFLDLEDMIPELDKDFPIRMAVQTSMVHTYDDMPNAARYSTNIVLRQILGITGIYSWMIQVGEFDMADGKPMTDEDVAAFEGSAETVAEIAEKIEERLLATNDAFKIRPGLIDIGSAQSMKGTWSYLNLEEVLTDGTDEENSDGDSDRQIRSEEDDDNIPF